MRKEWNELVGSNGVIVEYQCGIKNDGRMEKGKTLDLSVR